MFKKTCTKGERQRRQRLTQAYTRTMRILESTGFKHKNPRVLYEIALEYQNDNGPYPVGEQKFEG